MKFWYFRFVQYWICYLKLCHCSVYVFLYLVVLMWDYSLQNPQFYFFHDIFCPSSEPFLPIPKGPQQGSPPFRFPSQSPHRERDTPPLEPLWTMSQTPWQMSPLQVAQLSPIRKDAHPQSLPFITFMVSSKGAPLQVPQKSTHREGRSVPRFPFCN
jgi:hypothetical protein